MALWYIIIRSLYTRCSIYVRGTIGLEGNLAVLVSFYSFENLTGRVAELADDFEKKKSIMVQVPQSLT